MVKINQFFFDVSKIKIKPVEVGKTNIAWNGFPHTNVIGHYYEIDLTITNLTVERQGQILYLLHLNRPNDTPAEHLIFRNLKDDKYLSEEDILVDIPLNGFDPDRLEGNEELYEWDLTLRGIQTKKNYI